MDEVAIRTFITDAFAGVDVLTAPNGDAFFYYDPARSIPHDRRFPWATLVSGDSYDNASNLSRPGVYRLNVGVPKETYRRLFGAPPGPVGAAGVVDTGHDFAALDVVLPHPVYAPQSWVCVLSPSDATFERTVRPLLREAYDLAASRHAKKAGRGHQG